MLAGGGLGGIGCVCLVVCLGLPAPARAQRYSDRNLVPNPSFEAIDDEGMPVGWRFQDANAGARLVVDEPAHSGKRSAQLINPHGLAPHVYGTLSCRVRVEPNRAYTLSLYARSASPGRAWFGCGPRWERRMPMEATGEQWRRFTLTFTTYGDEKSLEPRINVDSQTEGLWIDSVQLEEGAEATDFEMPILLAPGESSLEVSRAEVSENLLANGSFERWQNGWPAGWRWDQRNTDATMTPDETRARSGRRSVKLTNGTRFGPHLYGQLLYAEPIQVKAEADYTISAYVLIESPGIAWVGGAGGWRVRAQFPRVTTGGKWVRVHRTFTTEPDETEIRIMVISESPTEGIWVDDVKLEEGGEPTPLLAGEEAPSLQLDVTGRGALGALVNPWMPDKYPASQYVFASELWATGYAMHAGGGTLRVGLYQGDRLIDEAEATVPEGPCARFEFGKELTDVAGVVTRIECDARRSGFPARLTAQEFELVTEGRIRERLEEVRPLVEELRRKVEALGERGHYPRVTLTVADNFMPWIVEDLAHGELRRAWAQAESVEEMVRRALARTDWPEAPKYLTSPVEIRGPSFIAEARWPDGRRERRPVFFVGMGHFGQVRRDAHIFPDYGLNIIQVEFGPNSVLPNEAEYSDSAIEAFLEACDRAAEAGTQVNLLISPHYFPSWAMEKWPHLGECSGGFLRYCVHAPEARQVIEKYLRYTIPRIKDHPALHSICLSNEPSSTDLAGCRFVRANWHAWLKGKYGTVARLNQTWRTEYAALEEIPVPEAEIKPDPLVYDFVRYNQEEFAGFHRFMADIIHEMAPELPVHAKMGIFTAWGGTPYIVWSIAPELFADFCEINGNDAVRTYASHGEWATRWQDEIMGFELQRCARDAPVFNSEDHIIYDRNLNWQSPTYLYNVYWQGAVHGRSASTAWVWERTYSMDSSACGSILHRPACVEAAGHCTLDLNRLAREVTALQRVKPRVALVYAVTGCVLDDDYGEVMEAAWRGCAFGGHKTGFVYERQLEALAQGARLGGYLSDLKVIIVAGLHHLSAKAMPGLQAFARGGGKILAVGGLPDCDEYGRTVEGEPLAADVVQQGSDEELMVRLGEALARAGLASPVCLVGEQGRPVYGIEYLAAPWQEGWLVNISNYRHEEPPVGLRLGDRSVAAARDLISGQEVTFPLTVPSLRPLLLYVR
jgi:hypothetical protein